jgi:hypothetical protein
MTKIPSWTKSYARAGAIVGVMGVCMSLAGISQRVGGQQMGGGPGAGRGGAESLGDLRFRNLGPAVAGGRVAAVAGVPGSPNIIYVVPTNNSSHAKDDVGDSPFRSFPHCSQRAFDFRWSH